MKLPFHLPQHWPLYLFGALFTLLTVVTVVGSWTAVLPLSE